MKYKYFIINELFNHLEIDNIDFFIAIGNYVNPEISIYHMRFSSDYKNLFEELMNELIGNKNNVKVSPVGNMNEFEKYDLSFGSTEGIELGHSSWTKDADGIVWTINLGGKLKSIPVKNWDEILAFIRDNI